MKGPCNFTLVVVMAALAVAAVGSVMLLVGVNVLVLTETHSAPAVARLWIVPKIAVLGVGSLVG